MSGFQHQKHLRSGEAFKRLKSCNRDIGPCDSFGRLPDHILLQILSFLPVKEAVKTSALSSRWKTLWCHSYSLDFSGDFYVSTSEIECCENKVCGGTLSDEFCGHIPFNYIIDESTEFLSRVKRVLEMHQSLTLDDFRIRLDYRYIDVCIDCLEDVIEFWIHYVFSKRVKRLDLDLLDFSESRGGRLDFDYRIGAIVGSAVPLTMKYLDFSMDFNSLKEVSLKGFDVSKEVIEHLLLKSRFLERVTIIGTGILNNLVVSSSSLKYLNITFAECMKSVKIRSCPNLDTLILDNTLDLKVTEVPVLFELHVYQPHSCATASNKFWGNLSQLEVLMLHGIDQRRVIKFAEEIPELTRLKKLIINFGAWDDNRSLIGLASLISACPNLQKLILQIFWAHPSRSERKVERIKQPLKLPHLKVVEVSGYYGRTCEDELLMYLLENAVAVEKLVVDPRSNTSVIGTPPFHNIDEENRARACAAQLLDCVPTHVQVVVL